MSSASTSTASVDLPEAGRPVSQTVAPLKPSAAARSSGVTAPSCQRVFAVFIASTLQAVRARQREAGTWMPHSSLSRPAQRPARPAPGSVQCVQPIES